MPNSNVTITADSDPELLKLSLRRQAAAAMSMLPFDRDQARMMLEYMLEMHPMIYGESEDEATPPADEAKVELNTETATKIVNFCKRA